MNSTHQGRRLVAAVSIAVVSLGCGSTTSSVAPPSGVAVPGVSLASPSDPDTSATEWANVPPWYGPDPMSVGGTATAAGAATCSTTAGQPAGTIVTVAGTGTKGSSIDGGLASESQIARPLDVVADAAGAVYFSDVSHRVRRIGPDGIITTAAGTGDPGFSGDGGPATAAQLNGPSGLVLGLDGSLFVADYGNARIRRIDTSGIITTVVGSGNSGSGGDGGPALEAEISASQLSVGADGTLYFDDTNRFRAVTDGIITTVAGTGVRGYDGDGGLATDATFTGPFDVAIAGNGAWYVSDYYSDAVRRIDPDGMVSTIVGGPGHSSLGDCGAASSASLHGPKGIDVRDGMLYIADYQNARVRRIALTD